jgi:hypothetical protein
MNIEDVFGNGTRSSQLKHMRKLEEEAVDTLFIVVSDVQLDNEQVGNKDTYLLIMIMGSDYLSGRYWINYDNYFKPLKSQDPIICSF